MSYIVTEGIRQTGIAEGVCMMKGEGPWKELSPESYRAYESLGRLLGGADPANMVRPCQKHTSHILKVDASMGGMGVVRKAPEPAADGLITDLPGMVLCVITADCVPVTLVDPVRKTVGIVHSGWKGTASEISARALQMMTEEYGTDPSDVIISVGPHICGKCYEVGAELIPRFEENFSPEDVKSFFIPKSNGKYLLDMSRAILCSLLKEGVSEKKVHVSPLCTYEDSNLYSYRRSMKAGEAFTRQNLSAVVLL